MARKKSVVEKTLINSSNHNTIAINRKNHHKSSSSFIGRIHALNKTDDLHENDDSDSDEKIITKKISNPSLIRTYQSLSSKGQQNGFNNTAKWLSKYLKPLHAACKEKEKIQMLDVGAVQKNSYSRYASWISCHPIDLQPLIPGIEKADLLTYENRNEIFDIVNLSLVLNFSGCPWQRGKMLLKARSLVSHPSSMGLIYIVLPRATICNSRYFDQNSVLKEKIMGRNGLDMELLHDHFSPKLYYSLWRIREKPESSLLTPQSDCKSSLPSKKVQVSKKSRNRNNFCILF